MARKKSPALTPAECKAALDEALQAWGSATTAAEQRAANKRVNQLTRTAACRTWMVSVKLPK